MIMAKQQKYYGSIEQMQQRKEQLQEIINLEKLIKGINDKSEEVKILYEKNLTEKEDKIKGLNSEIENLNKKKKEIEEENDKYKNENSELNIKN